jgi:hypothetical protein
VFLRGLHRWGGTHEICRSLSIAIGLVSMRIYETETFLIRPLFPEAEVREDVTQEVFRRHLACDEA